MKNRVKNFLLENETYEDGLNRALRCWAVQSEKLEQVEVENERLRGEQSVGKPSSKYSKSVEANNDE